MALRNLKKLWNKFAAKKKKIVSCVYMLDALAFSMICRFILMYGKLLLLKWLEGAASYAGLLLAPAEGFNLRPRPFFALQAKKKKIYVCFGPNFGNFWWSVVTSVTFSSNFSNFKKSKIFKNSKNVRKKKEKKKKKNPPPKKLKNKNMKNF